jgi:hypothetical protein
MMKSLLLAAVLGVLCRVGDAAAATIQIDYTGVVTQVNNTTQVSGYTVGQSITGKMILALPDTPERSYLGGVPFFDAYHGTGSSTLNGSQISGFGSVVNRSLGFASFSFGVTDLSGGNSTTNSVYFEGSPAPLLGSLANLPLTLGAIQNYLGNNLTYSQGNIFASKPGAHLFDITWNVASLKISPVRETPIPATLPLLVSAIGGLGLLRVAATRTKRKLD